MAGGYVHGVTTYTAGATLRPHRLVRIKAGTVTVPPEVEYTNNNTIIGLTYDDTAQGNLTAIAPLTIDGTFEIEVTVSVAINPGTYLYLGTSGRATDSDVSGIFLGTAVTGATQSGQIITFVSIVGGLASGDASDIQLDDAGGYFTSSNVEGALQEVGGWYERYFELNSGVNMVRTDSNYAPYSIADLGGRLASDTSHIFLSHEIYGSQLTVAQLNLGVGVSSHLLCTHPVISGGAFDRSSTAYSGVYYRTSEVNRFRIRMKIIIFTSAGFLFAPAASGWTTLVQTTGWSSLHVQSYSAADMASITGQPILVHQMYEINQTAGYETDVLEVASFFFRYKQKFNVV